MDLVSNFRIDIFNDGCGDRLNDYIVRFKGSYTIRINVELLLKMVPGTIITSKTGNIQFKMKSLDEVIICNGEEQIYERFHDARQKVRIILSKNKKLQTEIEQINKSIAREELVAYLSTGRGEREGFSMYFKERFPKKNKQKYSFNIGEMFRWYQECFEMDVVPKESIIYYQKEYRTKYRTWGDSYVYPIMIPYTRLEAKYSAKAIICTMFELGLVS